MYSQQTQVFRLQCDRHFSASEWLINNSYTWWQANGDELVDVFYLIGSELVKDTKAVYGTIIFFVRYWWERTITPQAVVGDFYAQVKELMDEPDEPDEPDPEPEPEPREEDVWESAIATSAPRYWVRSEPSSAPTLLLLPPARVEKKIKKTPAKSSAKKRTRSSSRKAA